MEMLHLNTAVMKSRVYEKLYNFSLTRYFALIVSYIALHTNFSANI